VAERYFIDDEPALVERLDAFLAKLRESLEVATFKAQLIVLLLGGGYGRGEGGVYRGPESDGAALYNDLEFYVITKEQLAPTGLPAWCNRWAEEGHRETGIEVEFKILPASALQNGAPSMFYYDLVLGHRVTWGDSAFCASLPATLRDAGRIPATEVTRLLFNRGSGLLFSREILAREDKDIDSAFLERNHAKAKLALADAVLALNGRYDWSCQTRQTRLEEALPLVPPDWLRLKEWHGEGVEFKLHPRHEFPGAKVLRERQTELTEVWLRTFLWAESVRLRRSWPDAAAYASGPGRIFPELSALKNIALRVRDRLRIGSRLPGGIDYPRGNLQRALALLLGSTETNLMAWKQAATVLGCSSTSDAPAIMQAYRSWWQRYN